jgi:hypothetical protein
MKIVIIFLLLFLIILVTGCSPSSYETCHNICETSNYECTADKSVLQCVSEINSNKTLQNMCLDKCAGVKD